MKRIFIGVQVTIIALLVSTNLGVAQDIENPVHFIPKTPEARIIDTYGDIQNNGNNGLPNITIPIHTIVVDNVQIPISISYSADGIRVNDIATPVGLKWALNVGGMVSREIKGLPDEHNRFGITGGWLNPYNNYDWYESLFGETCKSPDTWEPFYDNTLDISPDFFSYSTGLSNGRFVFKRNGIILKALVSNHLINWGSDSGNNIGFFEITDPAGNQYYFNRKETTTTLVQGGSNSSTGFNPFIPAPPTVWKPSKITTQKGNQILFSYEPYTYSTGLYPSGHIAKKTTPMATPQLPDCGAIETFFTNITYATQQVSRIETDYEIVKFNYSVDNNLSIMKLKLNTIEIYQKNDTINPIKRVVLQLNSYPGNPRLWLTGLTFYDQDNQASGSYSFDYENSELPQFGSFSQDVFGYYNGASNSTHMIPAQIHQTTHTPANREVNPNVIEKGVLQSISYPTGGSTHFEYEANHTVTGTGQIFFYPGIRVKRIIDKDTDSTILSEKLFEYGEAFSADFRILGAPYFDYINHRDLNYALHDYIEYSSNPISPYFDTHQRQAGFGYGEVKTIFPGKGNIVKRFSGFAEFNNIFFVPTEEIVFDENDQIVSTNTKSFIFSDTDFYGYPLDYQNFWDADNQKPYTFSGLMVCQDGTFCSLHGHMCTEAMIFYPSLNPFGLIQGNRKELQSQTQVEFFDGKQVKTTTNYQYNENQLLVEQVTTRFGENDQVAETEKAVFRYITDPDVNWIDQTTRDALIGANNIDKPLFAAKYINDSFPAGAVRSYVNQLGQTTKIKTLETDGNPQNNVFTLHGEYTYAGSKHRLIESETRAGYSSYVWNSNQQYPLAQIDNIRYAEIPSDLMLKIDSLNHFTNDLTNSHIQDLKEINDSIRNLAPPAAMITTYTYKPLVGVTSITNPAGLTIFYEYDGFGRLMAIRNHEGEYLEKYDYHYINQ